MKKIKKTISIEPRVWEAICSNSEILGISSSAYVSIACVNYMQQNIMLEKLPEIAEAFNKAQALQGNSEAK